MSTRGSVLVVDDEPTIAEVVSRYLERAGYETRIAGDGPQAIELAGERRPDLVVLDLMLPGLDGLEVMRRLRELGETGPRDRVAVILLTAKGEESDRVDRAAARRRRLRRQAVLARRARRARGRGAAARRPGAGARRRRSSTATCVIDPAARRVFVRGEEVALTQREFDLLLFLARHPGQAFTRTQLMDAVWQYAFYSDTSTVTVHIRRLRAKIEADPAQPRHVQTVWGVGYRFQP